MVKILLIILMTFLVYVTYQDYKYHCYDLKKVICFYPMVVILNMTYYKSFLIVCLGFLSMFLLFYIPSILNDKPIVGGLDIVIAPLFSSWFGIFGMFYCFVFILFYAISQIKFISNLLNKGKPDSRGIPMLPVMLVSFIISIFIFPNSISGIIFTP